MKLSRWSLLLHNQAVAITLALMLVVPLLFAAPTGQRMNQFTAYGLLGLLLLVVWLFRAGDRLTLQKARAYVLSGPNLPILLYLGWSVASLVWSADRASSQIALIQLGFGALVYAVVAYQFRHREQIRTLLGSLLLVSVAAVLVALAMRVQTRDLHNLSGTFHDRQLFGGFLGLVLPVLLGMTAGTRNRAWKIAGQLGSILVAGALILTQCRSAWIGFAVALIIFTGLSIGFVWKWKGVANRKHELLITPALGLVVIGIFVMFGGNGHDVQTRLGTFGSFSVLTHDPSVVDRVKLWQTAWAMILAKPLLGWGVGTYALVQPGILGATARIFGDSLSQSPHNSYLQIAAEQGWIGLTLYLGIIGMFMFRAVSALSRMERGLRQYTLIGCIAAVAGMSVDAIANPAWMYPEVGTFFWLVLGIGMCAAGIGQEVPETAPAPQRSSDTVLGMPRFLYRGLRTTAIGCAAVAMGYQLLNLDSAEAAFARRRRHRTPTYCLVLDHIDADYLNDGIPMPEAEDIHSGHLQAGTTARFKVYAVTTDPNEFHEITYEKRALSASKHGLAGTLKLVKRGPHDFVYAYHAPRGERGDGTIRFRYNCGKPDERLVDEFRLHIDRP